jgi:hypothetical protein
MLVEKPEGKRPLGRPIRSWENYNKIGPSGIRWGGMEWIDLARNGEQWSALVKTAINVRVAQNFRKFLSGWVTSGFPGSTQLLIVRHLICKLPQAVMLLDLYLGGVSLQLWSKHRLPWQVVFFSTSKPMLPSTSCPIHYSLTILPFHTLWQQQQLNHKYKIFDFIG